MEIKPPRYVKEDGFMRCGEVRRRITIWYCR